MYFLCPGSGEFELKGLSQGWGFDVCGLGVVGKIETEVLGFDFILGAEVAITAINTCLTRWDKLKEER